MKWIFEMNEFCVLCLNVDVKLHELSMAQAIVIENILKLNEFDVPWENQCHQKYHVCSFCLALLLKISNFMKMILNAQMILSDLSKTTDTITKPMLKSIDRSINGLNPLRVVSFGIFDDDEKMYHNQNTHQNEDVGRKSDSHVQECIKNCHKHNPDYNSTNEQKIIELHSSSDEDLQEPLINIILENELVKTENDPLEAGNKISKNNNTTNDSLETVNQQSKQNTEIEVHLDTKAAPQKIVTIDPESPYLTETESSSSTEAKYKSKKRKSTSDGDYQPDSTSHSEDSDFDSYDDTGKKIKKPKDVDSEHPKKCDYCNFETMRKRDLYNHYLQEHPDLEYPCSRENYYACSFCGKLVRHLKSHEEKHNERHYKCPKCPKVFSCNMYLTRHKNSVHGNKFVTCDYCSKSFKTKTDLGRHIRIHTGEKPFKCHICGAGFAHSGNRSIHIRSFHQNIQYNNTKNLEQKKIVRKNKKNNLTDTESESSGEQLNAKKRKRSRKQQTSNTTEFETEIEPASKKQSKERAKRTQKKLQNKNDTTRTECGTRKQNKGKQSNKQKVSYGDMRQSRNRNCQSDNFIEASDDSDDECLAEKKKRHNLESNKVTLHEEETAKGAFSLCRND